MDYLGNFLGLSAFAFLPLDRTPASAGTVGIKLRGEDRILEPCLKHGEADGEQDRAEDEAEEAEGDHAAEDAQEDEGEGQ